MAEAIFEPINKSDQWQGLEGKSAALLRDIEMLYYEKTINQPVMISTVPANPVFNQMLEPLEGVVDYPMLVDGTKTKKIAVYGYSYEFKIMLIYKGPDPFIVQPANVDFTLSPTWFRCISFVEKAPLALIDNATQKTYFQVMSASEFWGNSITFGGMDSIPAPTIRRIYGLQDKSVYFAGMYYRKQGEQWVRDYPTVTGSVIPLIAPPSGVSAAGDSLPGDRPIVKNVSGGDIIKLWKPHFLQLDHVFNKPLIVTFDSANAVLVRDKDDNIISGSINAASIPFTFDYDFNTQGGRTAQTDAAVSIVAQGLNSATWVLTTYTITRTTGQSVTINAEDERNYANPA